MPNNLNPMSNIPSGVVPMDTSNLSSQPTLMDTNSPLPQSVEGVSSSPVMSNLQVVLNNPNINNSPALQVVLNNMNTTSDTTGLHSTIVNTQVPTVSTSSSLATQSTILQTPSPVVHVQSPIAQSTNQPAPASSPSPQVQTPVTASAPLHSSVPQTTTAQSTFQQSASSTHLSSMSQGKSTTEHLNQILTKPRLQELVREVDPTEQLDEEVEELMLQLADDFVESAVNSACLLAKHRHASTVDVKDVQLHLERNWNMWIPGFGTDELRPYKRAPVTDAHRQRMALIRKTIKKY